MAKKPRGNPFWKPGKSGNPSGLRKDQISHTDGFSSLTTGLGVAGSDKSLFSSYSREVLSRNQCAEIWRGSWLAATFIEAVPEDALRRGYGFTGLDKEPDKPKTLTGKAPFDAPLDKGKDKAKPEVKKPPPFKSDAFGEAEPEEKPEAETEIATEEQPSEAAEIGELNGESNTETVMQKLKELCADDRLMQGLRWQRGLGGGALLLGVNDGGDPAEELDEDRVISFDFIHALECGEIYPAKYYEDPMLPKFGEPELYAITPRTVGSNPVMQRLVHESRVIAFPGIKVEKVQTGENGYWGDGVLPRVIQVMNLFNMSWQSVGIMLTDFAVGVFKIEGLGEMVSTADGSARLQERMQALSLGMSTARAALIDKDGEEFTRQQTPVSGMPELLDRLNTLVAAACQVPITRLFGVAPAGLNATGEGDMRNYYDRVASYQTKQVEPALRRLVTLILRAEGIKPEKENDWKVVFPPLESPNDLEQVQIHKTQMETDVGYINAGVLSEDEVCRARFGGPEYSYETQIDMNDREEFEKPVPPPAFGGGFGGKPPAFGAGKPPAKPFGGAK